MREDETLSKTALETYRFGVPQPLRYFDDDEAQAEEESTQGDLSSNATSSQRDAMPIVRWQDFSRSKAEVEKEKPKRLSKQRPRVAVSQV